MQSPADKTVYFYFDESGSPSILGRHGKNLLDKNGHIFLVGYIQTENPHMISSEMEKLRKELMEDEYLHGIPSISNLKNGFHANKDCQEVREKVFKLLKKQNFETYIIAARKREDIFRRKFDMSDKKLYKFLVAELLKNRVHLYRKIDIYFSEMGNITSVKNMSDALNDAINKFKSKWGQENRNDIRIFVQQASQHPLLQAVDYMLWSVYRAYERNEFRYYDFIKDKIKLVHDVFDPDGNSFYGTYYTSRNPLKKDKSLGS